MTNEIKYVAKYVGYGIVALITSPIWLLGMLGAWFVREYEAKK